MRGSSAGLVMDDLACATNDRGGWIDVSRDAAMRIVGTYSSDLSSPFFAHAQSRPTTRNYFRSKRKLFFFCLSRKQLRIFVWIVRVESISFRASGSSTTNLFLSDTFFFNRKKERRRLGADWTKTASFPPSTPQKVADVVPSYI